MGLNLMECIQAKTKCQQHITSKTLSKDGFSRIRCLFECHKNEDRTNEMTNKEILLKV